MSFDPDCLLAWKVPDKVTRFTRRDVAFYALSIGAGRDPANRDVLRYVDPHAPDLTALPSMALVLGYPGLWLADPLLGLDARRILHAEQSLEIVGPIPVEGEATGRTRVVGIADRGVEKGALVYSEREVSDARGQIFARLRQTHAVRGMGGFGSRGVIGTKPAASGAPTVASADVPVRPEQALLYRLNGDFNPIHSDPREAVRGGLPRPILHGMCTLAMAAWSLAGLLCGGRPEHLTALSARFAGPVFPGDTLRTEVRANGTFRAVAVERGVTVVDHGVSGVASNRHEAPMVSHAL